MGLFEDVKNAGKRESEMLSTLVNRVAEIKKLHKSELNSLKEVIKSLKNDKKTLIKQKAELRKKIRELKTDMKAVEFSLVTQEYLNKKQAEQIRQMKAGQLKIAAAIGK